MRVDLVSDLHMEHWENNYDFLKYKQSSILIVAGDVATDPELTSEWLTIAASEYKHVLFVCGNHEHTKQNFDLDQSCPSFSAIRLASCSIYQASPCDLLSSIISAIYQRRSICKRR